MRARSQLEHERYNATHYPGTRQLYSQCEEPTGRCEEDSMFVGDIGPLCEECWSALSKLQDAEERGRVR